MNNNSRPLLPLASSVSQSHGDKSAVKLIKRRSNITRVACNACRTRKAACNGNRPSCARCSQLGLECVYKSQDRNETRSMVLKREIESLKQTSSELEDLVHRMKYMPEDDAIDLLRQLRLEATNTSSSFSNSFDLDMQENYYPLKRSASTAFPPTVPSVVEKDLMADHPTLYPTWDSTGYVTSSAESYIPSPIASSWNMADVTQIASTSSNGVPPNSNLAFNNTEPEFIGGAGSHNDRYASRPLKSDQKAPAQADLSQSNLYCDWRLGQIDIGYWTTQPISNEYAARVLSLYLETDHPLIGLFDADLFLGDLVAKQFRFCSPLLISSLLARACQIYTSMDQHASHMSFLFHDEAERLWQAEKQSDSLTTIAALYVMCTTCIYHGRADLAAQRAEEARKMSMKMKLLGAKTPSCSPTQSESSDEWQRATAHTAWGAFNFHAIMSISFIGPMVASPPKYPIPGSELRGEQASLKSRYTFSPDFMGQTFPALCRLCAIIAEVTSIYHDALDTPISGRVALAFAHLKYQNILIMVDSLPGVMTRRADSADHVAIFHIWCHAFILDLFRPFVLSEKLHGFQSSSVSARSPLAIFAASQRQLKDLTLAYSLQYRSAPYSSWWSTGLLYTANAMLDMAEPDCQRTFLLCIHAYQNLYVCYSIYERVVEALLAMAMRSKVVSSATAQLLMQQLRRRGLHHKLNYQPRAAFVVDLDLALTNRRQATGDHVAQGYEEMIVFNEFTEVDQDPARGGPA